MGPPDEAEGPEWICSSDEVSRMKIAYIDCFSGISGDMLLGALVDAGVPLKEIVRDLGKLRLKGYTLRETKVKRAGLAATKIDVIVKVKGGGHTARGWKEIQEIITASLLPEDIKKQGCQTFKNLFAAEARVHGTSINATHLHELGCVDCLVDIFGALIGIAYLGISRVYASPVNVGSGTTRTAHGMMPVPAPATAEILKGIPCYASGPSFELATPTGAALLRTLSAGFNPLPPFISDTLGIGAGGANPEGWPNVLRIMIGTAHQEMQNETITVIETNIDDMNPQVYEYVMNMLFDHGARDVFLTPVIMKKSRPGTLLTVLCDANRRNGLVEIILRETTTIGVRFYEVGRVTMKREIQQIQTRYGKLKMKVSSFGGGVSRSMPEYEDCRRLSQKANVPLSEIMKEFSRALFQDKTLPKKKAGGR